MKKRSIFIVIVIIAILAIATVILNKYFQADKSLRYAYIPSALVDAPSAISQKAFSKNGIDAKPFSTGIETVQALIGNATDVATLAEWPFLLASQKRNDLRILAIISNARSMGMVANKDKGINTVSDLAGKTVGFPQGTSAQFVYETLVNEAGIKNKVKTINLTPPNLIPSLTKGDIDAMVVWQPFLVKAIQKNPNSFHLIPGSQDVLRVIYLVVSTESYIQKNPEGIKKLLKILIEADKKLENRNAEALDILSSKTNIDIETLNKLLPLFDYNVKIDSTIVNTFDRLSVWAEETGLAKKDILKTDWNLFIYPKLLKELEPENVKY